MAQTGFPTSGSGVNSGITSSTQNSSSSSIMDTSQLPTTSDGSSSGQAIPSQQQFLTIVQDPYPPLCSSPELFDANNNNANNYDQLHGFIDCIEIDENRR